MKIRLKGGSGSGHFGHAGRPGEVGGSVSGTERTSNFLSRMRKYALERNQGYIYDDKYINFTDIKSGVKPCKERSEGGFGLCYLNALNRSKETGEDLYIGFVYTKDDIDAMERFDPDEYWGANVNPLPHAWNVDSAGKVVDVSLGSKNAGELYIGFKVDPVSVSDDSELFRMVGDEITRLEHLKTSSIDSDNLDKLYEQWVRRRNKSMLDRHIAYLRIKGGSGSGFFRHRGRPGEVGGSVAENAPAVQTLLSDTNRWELDESYSTERGAHGISKTAKIHIQGDGDAIIKQPYYKDPALPGDVSVYSTVNDPYKEEDTYLLAQALGWDVVPAGAYASDTQNIVGGGLVSVQQWVDGAKSVHEYVRRPQSEKDVDIERFRQVAWIDTIIGNYDRHGSNLLIRNVNDIATPVAIDNGVSWDIKRYKEDGRTVRDSGLSFYDNVMSSDSHYGDVFSQTKAHNKEGRFPLGKQVSRKHYEHVKSFLDTDSPARRQFIQHYGDEWLARAKQRVDDVRYAADTRIFGYSWTD